MFSTSVTQLSSLQGEVDKILAELTDGKLGEAPKVPEGSLAGPSKPQVGIFLIIICIMLIMLFQVEEEEEDAEDDLEEMQSRLQALRS